MFYPLFVELKNQHVLVVGGGEVAERKVQSLLEAEAAVTVVAPDLTPALRKLEQAGSIQVVRRAFEEADVENQLLVISATDDPETQERVAAMARAHKILVNTVDQPRLCDFIVPATVRRGDVIASVSTSGRSPALAATLRQRIEGIITHDAARAARLLGELRNEVHKRTSDPSRRKAIFERIVESGILDWIAEVDDSGALERARRIIEELE
jgi:precorrin-2 dehydrogenase / sirohydrochlorin ferrochelatase